MARVLSRVTVGALELIGIEIARGRRIQKMTAGELCERAGISTFTLRRVERGDPGVAIGTVFELATLVGVQLFGAEDRPTMNALVVLARERLTLLPARVREAPSEINDDF